MSLRNAVLRVAATASLLALLSACTPLLAVPPTASAPVPGVPATAAKVPPEANAAPIAPPDTLPVLAVATDDTALLAGEAAREFEQGKASWYGPRFNGRRTASGERYNMHALTAAHKTLPFGTVVRVRSLVNGKEVDVRITDRGPFSRGRVIDLSRAAAESIGMLGLGVKDVLLLVPESTPAVAAPPAPVGRARVIKRAPNLR
ncbi:MAG: septal ring lytic transglycosylase RlpA family protein [Polaromonas sp.]|uniref:septal ring lytic transglycosylase RlpA family protein n=1 Tax=Polaromonas sp. TaxID=1869339 RepID=UPI0027345070|nr:septal ring lytic transglycosylase RlpA family protein [Polaromonas sp.]MDP2820253.1 septal ring lytic transglycosylase RlpA family protein [Polaromonas sp.]